MRILFLLLLVLFPNYLFALNYVDEFPNYVYGDVRPIAAIYNSIAMVTGSSIYDTLIGFALIFSVLSIGWQLMLTKDIVSTLKSGSFTMGMVAVMLTPVDVHIVDKRIDKGLIQDYYHSATLGYEKVSNVPWLIALAPSISTTISSDLIELVDDAFAGNTANYSGMTDIGKTSFSNLGYNKTSDIVNKIVDRFTFDEIGTAVSSNFKKDFIIYLNECVFLKTISNSQVTTKLTAPSKDIFTELSPASIGVDTTYSVTKQDGTTSNCVDFYNNEIVTNLKSLSSDITDKLSKIAGVNDITQISGLDNIMLADLQSTVFSQTTEQLQIYATNIASVPVIKAGIESFYRGTGISGQDLANSITAAKSTANLQTSGIGQFKWMAEILPFAMHFFFAVILASSILTLIMMLGKGVEGGTLLAKNYFGGFIQFEAIRVSLALIHNLVMYYASIKAVDKIAEFGGNPFALSRMDSYLEYVATMQGVSGVLAISAIFIVPAIALKGDVASVASAMQGLGGKYLGNDVQTSRDAVSASSARQRTVGNLKNNEEAMAKLNKLGLNLPPDQAPIDYYNKVTSDLANMSQGVGNMLSQDKFNDFSKGTVAQTANKVANTAGYGSTVSFNSASNVGYQDGQMQGYQTNATEEYRDKAGWDAKRVGTGNAISSVGKDLASMATADNASSDADFDKFAKGSYNQGAISTAKTKGAGEVNLSSADLENIGRTVKASIEGEVGKGRGIKENYDKYGDDVYKTSSEFGERSGIAKTMEKIKAQDGVDNAVDIDALDSSMKASQQEGSVRGSEKAYKKKARRTGKDFNQVIEDLAEDMAEGKTSADIATVDTANGNGGYVNYMTRSANKKVDSAITALQGEQKADYIDSTGKLTDKGRTTVRDMAEGKASADMRTVAELNENYVGGYVQSQEDNASLKAAQTMGALKAQKDKKMINDEGLTEKGIKANEIAPQEQVSILDAKHDTFYGKNAQKAANNVVKELKDATAKNAKLEAEDKGLKGEEKDEHISNEVKSAVRKLQKLGMVDENGNAITGDAMVSGLAKLGAMNYASSKTLTFNGMDINMGIDSSTGEAKIHKANASRNVTSGDLNTHTSGDQWTKHVDNKSVQTGAAYRSALQAYQTAVEAKGETPTVEGFMNYVKNAQLTEAHKNGIFGHLTAGVAEVTGMDQHTAEQAVAAGGAALGAIGLNSLMGNPIGKTSKLLKNTTDKLRGVTDETTKNSPKGSDSKNSNNSTNDTINDGKSSDSRHDNSSSKDLNNYNTSESKKAQKYNEKSLNDKKTDLVKKDPDKLARETMFNQAQQKYESNVDDFRSGKIDQDTFSKNNANLSSFMSKVNSGADIGMKDLKDVGIKPTQELPMETKMSKNNKPYEVINTSEYGQQLKEVEANKIRVAEENSKKFDANGNPKVEAVDNSPKTTVDAGKVQSPDVDTPKPQVQHPKIDGFATAPEAKASGMMDMIRKAPLVGKIAGIGMAGAIMANASDEWQKGNYAKSLFTASSLVDVTGTSDMALATIESREKMDAINASRQTAMYNNGGFVASLLNSNDFGRSMANMMGIELPNNQNAQMQQLQNQISPQIAQNQLNNIPTAMPFMANNPNGMAQQGLMSMVQQQYQNNTQAFNNGTMTQSAYNNSNAQLASVLSSIANSQPVSQQSLEYSGINPQNIPMNNGNVDMTALNSMVNNTTGGNASNFAQMLRDGGVRSEFANMQREQNPTADLEKLQMMEMTKNVEEMKENVSLDNINVTESELETLKKDMAKIRKRASR